MNRFAKLIFAFALAACVGKSAFAQSVTVSSPYNGEVVGTPFTLYATAPNCSWQTISAMGYSFDDGATTFVYSSTINAQIQSSLGSHTLHVKAWGTQGGACDTDVAITVTAASTSSSSFS